MATKKKQTLTLVEQIQAKLAIKAALEKDLADAQADYHNLLGEHVGSKIVIEGMAYSIVSRGKGIFALRPLVSKRTLQALKVQGLLMVGEGENA